MSTQHHDVVPYDVTEAELVEKAKLQRHFGRFDILFFLICTLVGVDTSARSPRRAPRRSPG